MAKLTDRQRKAYVHYMVCGSKMEVARRMKICFRAAQYLIERAEKRMGIQPTARAIDPTFLAPKHVTTLSDIKVLKAWQPDPYSLTDWRIDSLRKCELCDKPLVFAYDGKWCVDCGRWAIKYDVGRMRDILAWGDRKEESIDEGKIRVAKAKRAR